MNYSDLIQDFFQDVATGEIEIYNEFSLQHELGLYIRQRATDKKVQFERNIAYFGFEKKDFAKSEIDIAVFEDFSPIRVALEVKYPRNSRVPDTMFDFCKDISFIEQLVIAGFSKGFFLTVTEEQLFYSGQDKGIYSLFRSGKQITGLIPAPTGKPKEQGIAVNILGTYKAEWMSVKEKMKYCLIEVRIP